jgi:hypothetical protein
VKRIGSTAASASVFYHTLDVTASGATDYTGWAAKLTFAPGESSKTIKISIINDTLIEGDEQFRVMLSSASGAVLGAPKVATVTIWDNDH